MAVASVLLLFFMLSVRSPVLSLRCFVGDCTEEHVYEGTSICYFAIDETINHEMCGGYSKLKPGYPDVKNMKEGQSNCLRNQSYYSPDLHRHSTRSICFCNYQDLCNVKSFSSVYKTRKKTDELECYYGMAIDNAEPSIQKIQCKPNQMCYYIRDPKADFFGCTSNSTKWCFGDGLCKHIEDIGIHCCCNGRNYCNQRSYFHWSYLTTTSTSPSTAVHTTTSVRPNTPTTVRHNRLWCYSGMVVKGAVPSLKMIQCEQDEKCFYIIEPRVQYFGCTSSITEKCIGEPDGHCKVTANGLILCCCNGRNYCNQRSYFHWSYFTGITEPTTTTIMSPTSSYVSPVPQRPKKSKCYAGYGCKKQIECDGKCYYALDNQRELEYCGCVPENKQWCKNIPEAECEYNHYEDLPSGSGKYTTFCCCGQELCNKRQDFPFIPKFPTKKGVTKCWTTHMSYTTELREETCVRNEEGRLPSYCTIWYSTNNKILWAGCEEVEFFCDIRGLDNQCENIKGDNCCCDTDLCNDKNAQSHLNRKPPEPEHHPVEPKRHPVSGVTKCWATSLSVHHKANFLAETACVMHSDGKFPNYCYIWYGKDNIILHAECDDKGLCHDDLLGVHNHCEGGHCCCNTNMCNDKSLFNEIPLPDHHARRPDHRKDPHHRWAPDYPDHGNHPNIHHPSPHPSNKAVKIGFAPILYFICWKIARMIEI